MNTKTAAVASEVLENQSVGRRLVIEGFTLAPDVQQRLLEMGLTPGTPCVVSRYAPLGDPMEIIVRGYSLVMRRSEARGVQVRGI